MNIIEEALKKQRKAYLKAKTPFGVREGCDELNDASREVVSAIHKTYGQAYLVSINGGNGIVKYDPAKVLHNFCCDYCLRWYDTEVAQRIEKWNATRNMSQLSKLKKRLEKLNAEKLIWS